METSSSTLEALLNPACLVAQCKIVKPHCVGQGLELPAAVDMRKIGFDIEAA